MLTRYVDILVKVDLTTQQVIQVKIAHRKSHLNYARKKILMPAKTTKRTLRNLCSCICEKEYIQNSGKAIIAVWGRDVVNNKKQRKETGGE